MDLGAAYCSKECSKMDKLMSLANKSSPSISASALTPASASASSMKRFAHSPMTVTYPSMFKSSTLVPSSMSSRGGISKSAYTPIPAATTSIRCLPASRSAVRRQPLVLYDWAVSYRPWSPFVNQRTKKKPPLPPYRLIFFIFRQTRTPSISQRLINFMFSSCAIVNKYISFLWKRALPNLTSTGFSVPTWIPKRTANWSTSKTFLFSS